MAGSFSVIFIFKTTIFLDYIYVEKKMCRQKSIKKIEMTQYTPKI